MSGIAEKRLASVWFYGAVAISVFMVGTTVLNILLHPEPGLAALLLARFRLTEENNAAAWWSGMLLAVVSLHAYDGHPLLRRSEPGAAKGWAMLAAVLLFLSADEISSIHERLAMLGDSLSLGTWSLLLPLGAVLAAGCLRAWVLLWRAEGERHKLWPIAIGFLLLGSVALQEFLEHRIDWHTDVARAIRAAVEEGTELLGMLILLRVAMANTAELARRSIDGGRTAFAALHEFQRRLVTFGLALTPALALGTAALPHQNMGHPADWLAAVAFLAAGLVICTPLLTNARGVEGWATWVAGGLCCLASVVVVAVSPLKLVDLGPVEVSLRMLALAAISILLGSAWAFAPHRRQRPYALGAVMVGALALPLLPFTNLILVYGLSQLLGLVVYWVHSTVVLEVGARPGIAIRPRLPSRLRKLTTAPVASATAPSSEKPAPKR